MTTDRAPAPDPSALGLPADWPAPDPDAAALSHALAERLRARIQRDGPLPFDAWMESVLYEPGLGYYSAGQEKFGAAGDFITAPLVSPLFAWTLARQVAEALEAVGGDTLLELGPGDGTLVSHLLCELERLDCLPERVLLLERSASLRQRQHERLRENAPHLLERTRWLDALPDAPIRGVVLGNEVLDALPVVRFERTRAGVEELQVTESAGAFTWCRAPARPAVRSAVAAIEADLGHALPAGYVSEISPQLPGFMASVADILACGLVLLIDYGYARHEYYRTDRDTGTLVCHYRHRAHWDPLAAPGLQDVSAFVDFTAVALGARDAGLEVLGYTGQAHYLMGAGVTEVLEACGEGDPGAQAQLAQQARQLLLPEAMGERFRVFAAGAGGMPLPSGFSLYNHCAIL